MNDRIDAEAILAQMQTFDEVMNNPTHDGNELSHLRGTYELVKQWGCDRDVLLAALCHNAYDIDRPLSFQHRDRLRALIDAAAEALVYEFCALSPRGMMEAISEERFVIPNRQSGLVTELSREEFARLMTLALANWLEQRPRLPPDRQQGLWDEFNRARGFLPNPAYEAFLRAYGIMPGVVP